MDKAIAAAQKLVMDLNLPAQYHSVWVKSIPLQDSFDYKIMVSKNPGYKGKWDIPEKVGDFAVEQVAWPRGKL
jgi:hypothetical protein